METELDVFDYFVDDCLKDKNIKTTAELDLITSQVVIGLFEDELNESDLKAS